MNLENIDFGEAVHGFAKRAGVKLTQYRPPEGEKEKQRGFCPSLKNSC